MIVLLNYLLSHGVNIGGTKYAGVWGSISVPTDWSIDRSDLYAKLARIYSECMDCLLASVCYANSQNVKK